MKHAGFLTFAVIIIFTIFTSSCREDFEFTPSTGQLTFSKDTVFLDTVFTNIGSSTYTLKVYNTSSTDISIPNISMRSGSASRYRLNVDGQEGIDFENVPLLGKDSLFVFIETTFDIAETGELEFLHTDGIRFGTATDFQEVELATLVRDAIFLYPKDLADGEEETLLLGLDEEENEIRISGFVLDDDELRFTNEKPYVIYGYAAVAEGKTLTIEAGSRVHFHKDSGILVGSGGTLNVQGSASSDTLALENEVIFEGDRLEPQFADEPGQWGTVWFSSGSAGTIENLTIKNATVGLLIEGDDQQGAMTTELRKVQVHQSSSVGLWARNASVDAQNCVFSNAGNTAVYCNFGGSYDFKHCTIANYWSDGFRDGPALLIDDTIPINENELLTSDLKTARFSNCIIDGNRSIELLFEKNGTEQFNFFFEHCAIAFNPTGTLLENDSFYDFQNTQFYESVFLNRSVFFEDPSQLRFQLTEASEVLNLGLDSVALEVPFDILGVPRDETPHLGAYERLAQ